MFSWNELYESLLEKISEQAYKRGKAEELITYEMTPLTEHLIKMLKWEDSINNPKHIRNARQQWIKRIKEILLKSNVKFKKSHLDRIIVQESIDSVNMYLFTLRKDYDIKYGGELKAYRTDEEVEADLFLVLTELSNRLFKLQETKKDTVDLEEIFEELDVEVYGV